MLRLRQPGPGGRILPDGTLTLTVSKGKERYPLPDLEGMSESEAEARKVAAGA